MCAQRFSPTEARANLERELPYLPDEVVQALWTLASGHVEQARPEGAVLALLDALRIRKRPMTNIDLAVALGWHRETVGIYARRAERDGLIQRIGNRGWVLVHDGQ